MEIGFLSRCKISSGGKNKYLCMIACGLRRAVANEVVQVGMLRRCGVASSYMYARVR
jgi:hypothetical protein